MQCFLLLCILYVKKSTMMALKIVVRTMPGCGWQPAMSGVEVGETGQKYKKFSGMMHEISRLNVI